MPTAAEQTPPPTRGRPIDWAKRMSIADAARERFVAAGFEGLSMEGVAAAAGVSKLTVYRVFGDRAGLLAAVVELESQRMEAGLAELQLRAAALPQQLSALGAQLLSHLMRPPVMAFERALLATAAQHPELLRRFFDAGPGHIRRFVEALLAEHGHTSQRARRLAEELMAAWLGAVSLECRFGLDSPPSAAVLRERIDAAVARFALDGPVAAPVKGSKPLSNPTPSRSR